MSGTEDVRALLRAGDDDDTPDALQLLEQRATTALADVLEFKHAARKGAVERDAASGEVVVRGVKVLGERSTNQNPDGTRNRYPLETRQRALPLYEGAPVFLGHPPRHTPAMERGYQERLGELRNVSARPDATYADLHLNPKHPQVEQISWDAEHAPHRLGLSHNAQGHGRAQGTDWVIEEIALVRSVDVVARAATTQGLFESQTTGPAPSRPAIENPGAYMRGEEPAVGAYMREED